MESWKSLLGRERACVAETIYFVCLGNICRSAFAVEYARRCIPGTSRNFASAGVGAVVGARMDPVVFAAAREVGLDASDHVARQLTGRMLKEAALVIVFDSSHVEWIAREYPEYLSRTFLIGHLARVLREFPEGTRLDPAQLDAVMKGTPVDLKKDCVADPYRGGVDAARAAVSEIVEALAVIAPILF